MNMRKPQWMVQRLPDGFSLVEEARRLTIFPFLSPDNSIVDQRFTDLWRHLAAGEDGQGLLIATDRGAACAQATKERCLIEHDGPDFHLIAQAGKDLLGQLKMAQ